MWIAVFFNSLDYLNLCVLAYLHALCADLDT